MDVSTIERQVRSFISQASYGQIDYDDVTPDSSITNDLNVDSLAFMEILLEIENEWDIVFDDEAMQIGAFSTVLDLVTYIHKKLSS